MAYGLYEQKYLDEDTTVSIMIFPEATLPGSGTVVSGKMIKGISHFAGELGFLDYGMNRRELLKM